MGRTRHIYRELMDSYRYSSINTSNSRKLGNDALIDVENRSLIWDVLQFV